MKILFLFQTAGFSSIVASRLYQNLELKREDREGIVEIVNVDKRNVRKMMSKLKEAESLPQYVYCESSLDNVIETLKQYPECVIKPYSCSKSWDVIAQVRADMEDLCESRTVYTVPYKNYKWMGEVQEDEVTLFKEPYCPYFSTRKEAEDYAYTTLMSKRDLLKEHIESKKREIKEDEKMIEKIEKELAKRKTQPKVEKKKPKS